MSDEHQSSAPSRRRFLQGTAVAGTTGVGTLALLTSRPLPAEAHTAAPEETAPARTDVFQHAVASGDPLPDAIILWTRITPTPEATPGSGRGAATRVAWRVSTDDTFAASSIVASGEVTTSPERDLTVKVDAAGLRPSTAYYYRFEVLDGPAAGALSPVGRTRTTPAAGEGIAQTRLAVCSCSNWQAGWFDSYGHLADRTDIDYVLHLGDYIYEYEEGGYGGRNDTIVRPVEPKNEIVSLADYRIRLGLYHTDPNLQKLRRRLPLLVMWDDHESADNSWREGAENHNPEEDEGPWSERIAASRQAYFEWQPCRPTAVSGTDQLYRRFRLGTLAEISLPDLRSYRDEQLSVPKEWGKTDDPHRTMLGSKQFEWLADGIISSETRWQIVGTSVMISQLLIPNRLDPQLKDWLAEKAKVPRDGLPLNTDQWDGYAAERRTLLTRLRDEEAQGVVFVTGDIHSSWANDITLDPTAYGTPKPDGAVLATEFVATSITAKGAYDSVQKTPAIDAKPLIHAAEQLIPMANPWVRWVDFVQHGYGVLDVTPDKVSMQWQFIGDPLIEGSAVHDGPTWTTSWSSRPTVPGSGLGPYTAL